MSAITIAALNLIQSDIISPIVQCSNYLPLILFLVNKNSIPIEFTLNNHADKLQCSRESIQIFEGTLAYSADTI